MNRRLRLAASVLALSAAALALTASGATADEGMWTLDNLPAEALKSRYGFTASPDFVEHVRLGSVRFNDGGSGSFVSADGLVLTNHHVALGQLQKVSSEKKDYVRDGFFARKADEEMKCPDLELNQLVSLENVTARVLAAVPQGATAKDENEARKAEMSRIEKESNEKTGLRSDVVELYRGGEYWLYRSKKYTDIRLVMAPEQQAAFYGGDPDNFTYPRYDLDFAFFRAYENGKPVRPQRWFRFRPSGAKDGELVFVTGHPGSTDRLKTVSQLEYSRDTYLPAYLKRMGRRLKALRDYSARGPEQARRAKDRIFGFENSVKARTGEYEGLKTPSLMADKARQEAELRKVVAAKPQLEQAYGGAWDRIASAQKEMAEHFKTYTYRRLSESKLAGYSETIVRYVAETRKPNDKRYEEFRDSALESLRFRLFSPAPTYGDLEETLLGTALKESLEELGPEDPFVKETLAGRTPEAVAHELIAGTRLADVDFRKKLVEGGTKAVEASTDPLIVLSRRLDAGYREQRKWWEDSIQSVEAVEGNKIAKARFEAFGKSAYPDATFTLRLSYGKVAGYELGTTKVPYKTTFYGLYERAADFDNVFPFDLPALVAARRPAVDLASPLNFVTTNDIIGGNSGSPVLNRDAELVGLIFDGNIQSLVGRYGFSEEQSRAVAVHAGGIVEALKDIYQMKELLKELTAGNAG